LISNLFSPVLQGFSTFFSHFFQDFSHVFSPFSQESQAAIAGLAIVLGIVAVVGVLRRRVAGEVAKGGLLCTVP
jgi:hypothetical protein